KHTERVRSVHPVVEDGRAVKLEGYGIATGAQRHFGADILTMTGSIRQGTEEAIGSRRRDVDSRLNGEIVKESVAIGIYAEFGETSGDGGCAAANAGKCEVLTAESRYAARCRPIGNEGNAIVGRLRGIRKISGVDAIIGGGIAICAVIVQDDFTDRVIRQAYLSLDGSGGYWHTAISERAEEAQTFARMQIGFGK